MSDIIEFDFADLWKTFCVKARASNAAVLVYRDGGFVVELVLDSLFNPDTVNFNRYDTIHEYFKEVVPDPLAKSMADYVDDLFRKTVLSYIDTSENYNYRYMGRLLYRLTKTAGGPV